ncbi:2-amino-4-hydroxy-6-hydroxymethyldihydropteridine diphosphokinase [Psychrobacter sp. DAB_AL43B]|uniref:2-amino-4-hydroxy-6- hydroxymethyldihydropteridine diphosphokinase n=1 Tax=Psychrobacter sp. DAB_AL43B TaxID=1028416 RepID=UPI0009A690BE|nr:2-amino-4-hydroxy-6-hydroxymethyldihydropteridine diphosphokinase [Psychrobacter sp. DAB_AL43B]SLJ83357.1 2-amino-4-hydroxy-6-hydroxymethyldihydropteridinepyrophosphokinase [Psychrobacter sp. DAB_AL43B]
MNTRFNDVDSNDIAACSWIICYVGLGSNLANELGSPVEHLQQALEVMQEDEKVRKVRVSSFYASIPMGPQDQPDFVNAVAGFETIFTPLELLAFCQQLEQQAKRARLRHWGERSLDVDILLYGDAQIAEPQLTIPHAGLHERNFVLIPLRELAPELIITGKPITDFPHSSDWTGLKLLSNNELSRNQI